MKTKKWIVVAVAWVLALGVTSSVEGSESKETEQVSIPRIWGVVNLDTVTVDKMEQIPGIGSQTPARIVAYRKNNSIKT